jgi:peptide-methionine (S)-S-oxide reductase
MLVAMALAALVTACGAGGNAVPLPAPDLDVTATSGNLQSAVFAGGCFWGVEAVFRHTRGVRRAVSGYAGGPAELANYGAVSAGTSGHAEAVQVTFDPAQISYGQLLRIFFSVAHDPTELDRQGPDFGSQYRSAIFTTGEEQRRVAQAYVAQLQRAGAFARPIVTQIVALPAFHPAEDYHQDYVARHPEQPYVLINDLPKISALRTAYPELYVDR